MRDLLRFANALQKHTRLSARYTEMMTRGEVEMGPGSPIRSINRRLLP